MDSKNRYASYMLRLKKMQNDDSPMWVVSLQSTKTGQQHWFPNLNALLRYLQEEHGLGADSPNGGNAESQNGQAPFPNQDEFPRSIS